MLDSIIYKNDCQKINLNLTQEELKDIVLPEQAKHPLNMKILGKNYCNQINKIVFKIEVLKMIYKIWNYQFKAKSKIIKWFINKIVKVVG